MGASDDRILCPNCASDGDDPREVQLWVKWEERLLGCDTCGSEWPVEAFFTIAGTPSNVNPEVDGVELRLLERRTPGFIAQEEAGRAGYADDRQVGEQYLEVRVRSEVFPMVKRIGVFERLLNQAQEAQKIGILAGALAEELCEAYGDTLDPSQVARAALEAYRAMTLEQGEMLQGYEGRTRH